jgi:hypothetical protein
MSRSPKPFSTSERKYIREPVSREMDWRDREWFVANLEEGFLGDHRRYPNSNLKKYCSVTP